MSKSKNAQPANPIMAKKPEKPPNHERWVISYADLLTLLLATFVVLYASSSHDKHKQDQVAASFVKAFVGTPPSVVTASSASKGVMSHQPSPIPHPIEAPASANSKIPQRMAHQMAANIQSLAQLKQQLNILLHPMIARQQVSMTGTPLTLTIQLDASVLFPSGQASLKPDVVTLLKQVAGALLKLPDPFRIVVQGFTDDQPISNAQFPSNWSLSAERAVSVVQLFIGDGVPGSKMAAEGFGQFAPIAPNTTDAGRAKNRRVTIVVHAPEPAGS
ncbi:MAG: flagellar motor protein MotB [Acidocella sp.]|nr:flagellar motor protein MotB [Acidocella sp.]